ncbi:MAG: hypothetical protein LBI61_01670 [Puniceicoccales bacterium]|nr:hypothetical protein [Puniceicoccales bacterium]
MRVIGVKDRYLEVKGMRMHQRVKASRLPRPMPMEGQVELPEDVISPSTTDDER